jgi:hypothetical protein
VETQRDKVIKRVTLAFILIFMAIAVVSYKRRYSNEKSLFIKRLPQFEAVDQNGRILRSHQLYGRTTYLQFVNTANKDDLDLIKNVYENWRKEDLNIVAFVNNERRFTMKSPIPIEAIYVIKDDYAYYLRRFRAPHNAESYYIADRKGKVIATGYNRDAYEKDVKTQLLRSVKQEIYSTSYFIDANKNIKEIEWLGQISSLVQKGNKKYFLISFFTKICDTCSGGTLIQMLKELHGRYDTDVMVVIILLDSYGQEDAINLQSQLFVKNPVLIADASLSHRWRYLINKYREDDLTDILILVDENGRVRDIADRNCRCWNRFHDNVRRIIDDLR